MTIPDVQRIVFLLVCDGNAEGNSELSCTDPSDVTRVNVVAQSYFKHTVKILDGDEV